MRISGEAASGHSFRLVGPSGSSGTRDQVCNTQLLLVAFNVILKINATPYREESSISLGVISGHGKFKVNICWR